jgi:methionyl-tRNA formyltransferase
MRLIVNEPASVVFMGTPDFAVPSLRALVEHSSPGRLWASGLDIAGVFTRLDKPAGRGRSVVASAVKRYALEQGIPVYQPGTLRSPDSLALLRSLAPSVIVVAAFGMLLPPEVLDLPPHCCLNVHASLLPRYRGASPIPAAILAGVGETGVTLMQMDEGLDTGPIVAQRTVPIAADDTTGTLTTKLAEAGADLLVATLPRWLAGGVECQDQDDSLATMTRPLRKEEGRLDWTRSAVELGRRVRAVSPWPGAFTTWNGRTLKILSAHPVDTDDRGRIPGQCFSPNSVRSHSRLACACGQEALELDVIQLEGKRALPAAEALRGYPALADAQLDT